MGVVDHEGRHRPVGNGMFIAVDLKWSALNITLRAA